MLSAVRTERDVAPVPAIVVWLAYAYLFIYYVRPQDNVPGLDAVPWVALLFWSFALWGMSRFKVEYLWSPIGLIFWLGLLFAITGIGAKSPVSYQMSVRWILLIFPQAIALYVIFTSGERIKSLLNWWCVIYFFLALLVIRNAPRGAGDFTWDPNDAALALSMGLPLVIYGLFLPSLSSAKKYFYAGTAVLILVAFVLTNSRGGFLGILAVLATMWWLSKKRLRNLCLATLASVTIGVGALGMLPSGYVDEMNSILDFERSTTVERLRLWEIGWIMFKAKPLLGIGAHNFRYTSGDYQSETSWWTGREKGLGSKSAHSLYLQVIPELGLIGIAIYAYIMFVLPLKLLIFRNSITVRDAKTQTLILWCNILISSMAGYAVAGIFISVAYYPHIPFWLIMYSILMAHANSHLTSRIESN